MLFIKRSAKCSIALVLLLSCAQVKKKESRIGPFDLSVKPITESEFIKNYGGGWVEDNRNRNDDSRNQSVQHAYFLGNKNLWLRADFSHVLDSEMNRNLETILVSKQKLCDEKYKLAAENIDFGTGNKIKIGDTYKKVVDTYGQPKVEFIHGADKKFSLIGYDLKGIAPGRIFRYFDEKSTSLCCLLEFYFVNDDVHTILLSSGE